MAFQGESWRLTWSTCIPDNSTRRALSSQVLLHLNLSMQYPQNRAKNALMKPLRCLHVQPTIWHFS